MAWNVLECLKRVEEITNKEVISICVDLCDKDELNNVFTKVSKL
jgi:hypothetical protein